ncbi:hypothetical protein ACP4OV_001336 [Aristida adscensionis]
MSWNPSTSCRTPNPSKTPTPQLQPPPKSPSPRSIHRSIEAKQPTKSIEMASSSTSPAPPPPWVILGRIARVRHDHDAAAPLSVALAKRPRVSTLTVPTSLHPAPTRDGADRYPYVVAADDHAGLLLLHVSASPEVGFHLRRHPPGVLLVAGRDFLPPAAAAGSRDAATCAAVARLPARDQPGQVGIHNLKNVGLVSAPGSGGAEYMVVELRVVKEPDRTTLHCFRSGAAAWEEKVLLSPPMARRHKWSSSDDVISLDGRLWWVDLVWGVVGCDPFADRPVLTYVSFSDSNARPKHIETRRMVRVSQGEVRFVELSGGGAAADLGATQVVVSTLFVSPDSLAVGWWRKQCSTSLELLWASDSYRKTGMPEELPVPALLHPNNANLVYFFLRQHLFGVNVDEGEVVNFVNAPYDLVQVAAGDAGPVRPPPISWRYVLAWVLPHSLANAYAELDSKDNQDGKEKNGTAQDDQDVAPPPSAGKRKMPATVGDQSPSARTRKRPDTQRSPDATDTSSSE